MLSSEAPRTDPSRQGNVHTENMKMPSPAGEQAGVSICFKLNRGSCLNSAQQKATPLHFGERFQTGCDAQWWWQALGGARSGVQHSLLSFVLGL